MEKLRNLRNKPTPKKKGKIYIKTGRKNLMLLELEILNKHLEKNPKLKIKEMTILEIKEK